MSVYEEFDEPEEPVESDDAAPLGELPAGDLHVCDFVDPETGELCGASFPKNQALAAHRMGKHRDKSADKRRPPATPRRGKKDTRPNSRSRPSSKESAPRKAAARVTPEPAGGRAATYASSLAMAGLGAYLVIPAFDKVDLDIVNAATPNLADALEAVGNGNQTFRTTCDLILGGGAGGAYIQLLFALSAMVVPMLAHHGVVPPSAGARFGEMIGGPPVAPAAAPPAQDAQAPTSHGPGQPDFAHMGPDEVLAFFSQVPPTVLFDLAGKMFGNMDPTVVDIGAVSGPENLNLSMEQSAEEPVDGERGSEQLAPDTVPVPT